MMLFILPVSNLCSREIVPVLHSRDLGLEIVRKMETTRIGSGTNFNGLFPMRFDASSPSSGGSRVCDVGAVSQSHNRVVAMM